MKKNIVKAYLLIFAGVLFLSNSVFADGVKQLNTEKSKMDWVGKKVTGQHSGTIKLKEGNLTFKNDAISKGSFVVDMTSIANSDLKDDAYRAKLEGHLKSDDFFGVKQYPESKFEIVESNKLEKGQYSIKGNVTIKGITKPIEFTVNVKSLGENVHVSGKMVIDRTKFNVRYGSGSFFDNLGDKTIYDDFELNLDLYLK